MTVPKILNNPTIMSIRMTTNTNTTQIAMPHTIMGTETIMLMGTPINMAMEFTTTITTTVSGVG
jgi:hypothetical protein